MSFRSKRSKVGSLLDPKEPKLGPNESDIMRHAMVPIEPIEEIEEYEEGKTEEIK